MGNCFLHWAGFFFQRIVDGPGIIGKSANNSQVCFFNLIFLKKFLNGSSHSAVKGEKKNTRGFPVEAVNRKYVPVYLVSEQLHGKLRCIGSNGAPVHQQAVRLVDGDEVIIVEYDFKIFQQAQR